MYQRDVKSQPDSAPDFRSAHSCSFCSEEKRKSSSNRSTVKFQMTRNTRDMRGLFLYPQRVLQLIPDRLCRIRAWKHLQASPVWKFCWFPSQFVSISHLPGEVHLDVISVQHVRLPISFQGHGTVLHPEAVLPLQSRQSFSKNGGKRGFRIRAAPVWPSRILLRKVSETSE